MALQANRMPIYYYVMKSTRQYNMGFLKRASKRMGNERQGMLHPGGCRTWAIVASKVGELEHPCRAWTPFRGANRGQTA